MLQVTSASCVTLTALQTHALTHVCVLSGDTCRSRQAGWCLCPLLTSCGELPTMLLLTAGCSRHTTGSQCWRYAQLCTAQLERKLQDLQFERCFT
jgi:hypothetical protein